jgi:hypothetical protein
MFYSRLDSWALLAGAEFATNGTAKAAAVAKNATDEIAAIAISIVARIAITLAATAVSEHFLP